MDKIKHLTSLTRDKKSLLIELLEITEAQKAVINNMDSEMLMNYITCKQGIIDKIDVLDKEYVEMFETLKEELGVKTIENLTDSIYIELKDETTKVYDLLQKIQDIEWDNSLKVKEQIEELKVKMQQVKAGKNSIKGYGGAQPPSESFFIDKKR
jgi:hypothetical protein